MTLTKAQREAILTKIQSLVTEKYFDPAFNEAAWQEIVRRNRAAIVAADDTPGFEEAVSKMLTQLSPRTLGLLSDHAPITPRNAINASFAIEVVGIATSLGLPGRAPRGRRSPSRPAPWRRSPFGGR